MKSRLRVRTCLWFALSLTLFSTAFGQSWTPKYNVSMTTHSLGYYEYLPAGYNTGSQKYPLLIFFHGAGEKGNGSEAELPRVLSNGTPKQINSGIFPKTFTVNGNTYSFIVLAPQITDGAYPFDVNNIINYAISHYRVDTSRIYLTGLSMGGGLVWDYPGDNIGFALRVTAIVPVCGAAWPSPYKYQDIALGNVAVWATHNRGDGTVPAQWTIDFVNGMNSQKPPPKPLAKMTIFEANSHDAWTKTYDLNFKENGLNVYEWMLQYQKQSVLPVNDLKFDAVAEKSDVALHWSTSSEENNYGYTIERSNDGSHFDSLAFVPSPGNAANKYDYIDFGPAAGQNFYRLKIIGLTGKVTFSEVRNVLFSGSKTISLFPNPVDGVLHIQSGYDLREAMLTINDMSGKKLMQEKISGVGNHSIPVHLVAGMYVASIIENGKIIFRQTFLKK